jgi:predicted enzyme related to lactoylglutathione lyase
MIAWSVMWLCVHSSGARVDIQGSMRALVNGIERFYSGAQRWNVSALLGDTRMATFFRHNAGISGFSDQALTFSDRNLVLLCHSNIGFLLITDTQYARFIF